MSLFQWFAQEYFSFVRKHDEHGQEDRVAFCECSENKQTRLLHSHYVGLSSVQNCEDRKKYPQSEKKYDLFIKTKANERLYCEIKGMYKTWFLKQKPIRPYPAYLWSPFQDSSRKKDSAGFDLRKLATLPSRLEHNAHCPNNRWFKSACGSNGPGYL